jgi:hypothetical protein
LKDHNYIAQSYFAAMERTWFADIELAMQDSIDPRAVAPQDTRRRADAEVEAELMRLLREVRKYVQPKERDTDNRG